MQQKEQVREFWNKASCGEELFLHGNNDLEAFVHQANERYRLEPYIFSFANFTAHKDKKVLEIGVGLGADHQQFAEAGADLYGIDLTERAVENTKKRFKVFNLHSNLSVGDAENLSFPNEFFDLVYSWGVTHHSPNTEKAVDEIWRVLKPGGQARIMIYHTNSIVGYMLWIRYALFTLRPFTPLKKIYEIYLESPGTKAYTIAQARQLFGKFSSVNISTQLTHGDLLTSKAGQRHRGLLLKTAKAFFPRLLIRKLLPTHGLFMLITATK